MNDRVLTGGAGQDSVITSLWNETAMAQTGALIWILLEVGLDTSITEIEET